MKKIVYLSKRLKKPRKSTVTPREKDILKAVQLECTWYKTHFEKSNPVHAQRDWDFYHGGCSALESISMKLDNIFKDESLGIFEPIEKGKKNDNTSKRRD